MKCPVDFRRIPANDWARLTDALQTCFDELFRQDEYRSKEYLRDGQKTDAYLPAIVLGGTIRNHKYRVGVNDSDPAAPVIEIKDIGR